MEADDELYMIHHYLQRGILPEKVLARPEIEKVFFLASAKKANDDEYAKWKALGGE